MKQKPERNFKKSLANSFGALGYFFGFLEWFWAVMLYFSILKAFTLLVSPHVDQPLRQHTNYTFTAPSPLEGLVIGIITIVMVLVTVYVLIKMPSNIVKTGNKVVHKTTTTMAPIVIKARHIPDTKKSRAILTGKLMIVIKLFLIVVPVGFTIGSSLLREQSVDYSIAVAVGCTLASFSLFFFAVQYLLAAVFHLKLSQVR